MSVEEHGLQQAAGFRLGGGELGFQLVAQSHQLIDLGIDAVLLGEGRKDVVVYFRHR